MSPKPVVPRSLRAALLGSIASALVVGVAPASAQDQSTDQTAQQTIIVTGSRIPQANLKSVSPIQVISDQEFKLQGKTEVSDVLNNLPQNFQNPAVDFSNVPNPLSGPGGATTADLRGLGPQRTLVLVDGVRLGTGDPNAGNPNPAPDLDQIPGQLVERVDVVTGGASATYGSDAVAGVVNFIMKKDFQGIQIDGQYGFDTHTNDLTHIHDLLAATGIPTPKKDVMDGRNKDLSFIMGANSGDGNGNVTAYFGYHRQAPVSQGARDFSSCLLGSLETDFVCLNSSNSNLIVDTIGANPANSGVYSVYQGFLIDHPAFVSGVDPGVSPPPTFNPNPFQYLSRDDTRYTAGYIGHYDINDHFKLYSQLNFMDDRSTTQVGPTAVFQQNGVFQVNCDSPLLSDTPSTFDPDPGNPDPAAHGTFGKSERQLLCTDNGLSTAPGTTDNAQIVIGRRDIEGGPRQTFYDHTSYRILVGTKGDLIDGWTYDLYGQYYWTDYVTIYSHDLDKSHIAKALQVVTDPVTSQPVCKSVLDKTDPLCVPWNVFQQGGVTQAALDYVGAFGEAWGNVEQQIVDLNFTGDLAHYGIKSPFAEDGVSVNFGTEYRREAETYTPDKLWQSGLLTGAGGATPATVGAFNVMEGFGEIRAPLMQKKPLVEDLVLDAGYRYSSYSEDVRTDTYKLGLQWAPTDDVRFRVSFQRAVRAPNLTELFVPEYVTNSPILTNDPCATATPTATLAQCLNTGVLASQYGTGAILQCPSGQCGVEQGGNNGTIPGVAALKPETSSTFSFGLIFTPTFISGLTASIDYYNIAQHRVIGVVPITTVFNTCLDTGDPLFCSRVHRTPQGFLFGDSIVGGGFVFTPLENLASTRNSGIDFQGSYTPAFFPQAWGSINLAFVGTYLQHQFVKNANNLPTYDCAGLFGPTCGTLSPTWRHTLRMSWQSPWDFLFSVNWRHIGSMDLDTNPGHPNLSDGSNDIIEGKLSTFDYFDLSGTWDVISNLTLRAGINNIFDKQPPIISGAGDLLTPNGGEGASGVGGPNSYPTYDLLGRQYFIGFTAKF